MKKRKVKRNIMTRIMRKTRERDETKRKWYQSALDRKPIIGQKEKVRVTSGIGF